MSDWIELDPGYSTTRRVRKVAPEVVEAELKAAQKPEDQFETILFQPECEGRKGQGGLRTKGYFKKSSEEKPLITVITVVFNGEEFLEETILSVINQNYDNVEYIIIDGGSSDGTLDIIRKYEQVIDYWVSEEDKGIYDAMNKSIDLILGCWVMFINAGDKIIFLDKNSLLEKMSSKTCYYYSEKKNKIIRSPLTKLFLTRNTPCHQSIQYLKKDLKKFDPNIGIEADYEQMTRIVDNIFIADYSESITYFNIPGASGKNNKKWAKKSCERVKIVGKNMGMIFGLLAAVHLLRILITQNLIRFINQSKNYIFNVFENK